MADSMKIRRQSQILIGLLTALAALALLIRTRLRYQSTGPDQEPVDRARPEVSDRLEEADALLAQAREEARQMALKASLHVY